MSKWLPWEYAYGQQLIGCGIPPPAAWTVDTGQVKSMDSWSLWQALTLSSGRKKIKIHQTRLLSGLQLSSVGEPVPTAASVVGSQLTEVQPDVAFCCYSVSASRFDALCVPRCFTAHHNLTEWLSELASACQAVLR